MRDEVVGRLLRMVRLRKGWTQAAVSERAGVSIATVSRNEGGRIGRQSLELVQRHAAALDLRAEIMISGRGGDLDRLFDREHAAIVEWLAGLLADEGWTLVTEASYSVFGERGRIDLLAYHPATRTVLIVEVKTELADLQRVFGSADVRERLAPQLARDRGWEPDRVVTLLAVADTHHNRSVVRAHPMLFSRFERNAARVRQWIHRPISATALLLYVAPPPGRPAWLASRRRVDPPQRSG